MYDLHNELEFERNNNTFVLFWYNVSHGLMRNHVPYGYPTWKKNQVTQKVYYVTQEGSDSNTGENITEAFAIAQNSKARSATQ